MGIETIVSMNIVHMIDLKPKARDKKDNNSKWPPQIQDGCQHFRRMDLLQKVLTSLKPSKRTVLKTFNHTLSGQISKTFVDIHWSYGP